MLFDFIKLAVKPLKSENDANFRSQTITAIILGLPLYYDDNAGLVLNDY